MLFELFRFIFGYVTFRARDGFAERFINVCTAHEIPLWNISKQGNCITACTTMAGYKKIRKAASESSMKVRLVGKHGLPFIVSNNSDKLGLVIGFFVFIVGLIFLSGRVWTVNVTGNSVVSPQKIEQVFDESGLCIGRRVSKLNRQRIVAESLIKINEISWATINIRGCTANIEVREAVDKPEVEKKIESTSNIVASKDGQIEIVEAYKGTPSVKAGQTVMKGNLLISGIKQTKSDTNLFSHAQGYVVAGTTIKVKSETEKNDKIFCDESKKVCSLYIFGKEFSLRKNLESDVCYLNKTRAVINGVVLPFGINYRTYTKFSKEKSTSGDAVARLEALNDFALQSYNRTLHTQITSQEISVSESDNKITVTGEYNCYENIGSNLDFEVEENPSGEN